MNELTYVVAGYCLTALAIGGYVAHLMLRARRARARIAEIGSRLREG